MKRKPDLPGKINIEIVVTIASAMVLCLLLMPFGGDEENRWYEISAERSGSEPFSEHNSESGAPSESGFEAEPDVLNSDAVLLRSFVYVRSTFSSGRNCRDLSCHDIFQPPERS